MLFKESITLRILELCNKYNYTPNKLDELSAIETLKIELKDFYVSPLFDMEKLEY